MPQAVRQRLRPASHPRRSLDERIAIRFPGVIALQSQLIRRLRPSSRLRQVIVARSSVLALAAFNRRDYDAISAGPAPGYEYRPARHWVEAGLVDDCYRGREGHERYIRTVDQVWGGENYLEAVEVVDLGDRVLLLADSDMRAQASGVPLSEQFALVMTLRDGRPVLLEEYYDHAEALALFGLE